MLNGGVLNGHVLNGAIGDGPEPPPSGQGIILSFEQLTIEYQTGSGIILSFEQKVGEIASGLILSFEQDVQFLISGSGLILSFEQDVGTTASGIILSFEQRVIEFGPTPIPSHLDRSGWDAVIMLNGVEVPEDKIHGGIRIERTEGGASVCNFTLVYKPGAGIQNVETLAGKPVTIDFQTADGTFRVYTGVVDIPEIDLIQKKITINCTDRRLELINAQLGAIVPTIGYYSSIIFPPPKDVAEQLEQRLTTIPYSVDFDAFGVFNFTERRAKAVADFVLTADDVYDREPSVSYTSRDRIVNKISINFNYRYPRLHHMQRHFSWESPIHNNICLMLLEGYTLAQKVMIEAAVYSSNWILRGDILYIPIHNAGWYCGVGWATTVFTASAEVFVKNPDGTYKEDANGKRITTTAYKKDMNDEFILDSSGNKIADLKITGGTDYFPVFADGASWDATTRWAQTITETYSLVVKAPQSINLYGIVENDNAYSAEDDTDAAKWEDYTVYDNPFGEIEQTYYVDAAAGRSNFNSAIVTALNIAKTTILNSHRDTRVSVNRFLWPQIDLKHTVLIDTPILRARGKVVSIIHDINNGTTEAVTTIVIALSRSIGSQAETPFNVPAIPSDSVNPGSSEIVLGNHYGEDPESPGAENWTGRVGNKYIVGGGGARTQYSEQFIVRTPDLPESVRDEKIKTGGADYDISIPNDLLEVIF